MPAQKGFLLLIPTPLGDTNIGACLPANCSDRILPLRVFIVEEIRTARRFLRKIGYQIPFDTVTFLELNEHTPQQEITSYLDAALQGENIGLLSEAGLPCVADPGNKAVALAHQMGITVKPLVGPSSLMLALMASGLNGQNFTFHGYLPVKPPERAKALKALEFNAQTKRQTQIFIETPYRNQALLETILSTCQQNTLLCIACDLTIETEFIKTQPVAAWKKSKENFNKRPAVFLIGNTD